MKNKTVFLWHYHILAVWDICERISTICEGCHRLKRRNSIADCFKCEHGSLTRCSVVKFRMNRASNFHKLLVAQNQRFVCEGHGFDQAVNHLSQVSILGQHNVFQV